MNKLLLSVVLVAILTGCTKTVYVDENGKAVSSAFEDYTKEVKEVCINGVVYYKNRSEGSSAFLTPKIRDGVLTNSPLIQKC